MSAVERHPWQVQSECVAAEVAKRWWKLVSIEWQDMGCLCVALLSRPAKIVSLSMTQPGSSEVLVVKWRPRMSDPSTAEFIADALVELAFQAVGEPIPLILSCPKCGTAAHPQVTGMVMHCEVPQPTVSEPEPRLACDLQAAH